MFVKVSVDYYIQRFSLNDVCGESASKKVILVNFLTRLRSF